MKDLPLIALRALAAVHAHNGVRAAAAELGIAHSSVSRHLAQIEAWLGIAIVQRAPGPRGFALTPQGRALAVESLASMGKMARAVAAVRERRSARSITISTTPSVAARWLLPKLTELERSHPGLEVSVSVDQKLDDLRAKGIDVALRVGRGAWPDLVCEPLMDDALYPVMSPALFERAGRPRSVEKLGALRLLHDRDPFASWSMWRDAHAPADLDVKRGPRFASSDLVLQAAVLSQGVALARHRLAAADLASGALIRPFGGKAVVLREAYWLVRLPRADRLAAVRAVVGWLKERALADGAVR